MLNQVFNEDCRSTLKNLPDCFVDLTVTSPPYNVDLGNNKYNDEGYDQYFDDMPYQEYLGMLRSVFSLLFDKTKNSGRCVVNIGDGKNGSIPTHSDVIQIMQEIGWEVRSTIIWNKKETSNRAAWGSYCSPSCPSFPRPFEYVLIFYKGNKKLQHDGETDITEEEFENWAYGIWEFPGASHNPHPAPFPEELPKRCVKMLSYTDATVYDPFVGSGTTLKVAKDLGRYYIGSEISEEYFDMIQDRLSKPSQKSFV